MNSRRAGAGCRPVRHALFSWLLILLPGAGQAVTDADVIVIGAGIAGISAALEASDGGARVLLIEAASVAGGHAVKAGGFALVDTPLQQRRGYEDTPDTAYADLMAWGEDASPEWVRRYAERSRTDVYDWLTGLGVEFTILLDTPEDTVPRFHFAGGTAVNVVVPMLRNALSRDNLQLLLSTRAEGLARTAEGDFSILTRNQRTSATSRHSASSVIIATGGFQSNLALVTRHFRPAGAPDAGVPERMLIGSGHYATGGGLKLGEAAGANLVHLDRQVIFVNGLPDPRDPQRGLKTENPAAIRVNSEGRRFINESATSKALEKAVLQMDPAEHWLIFDAQGRKKLRIQGAVWLDRRSIVTELLENPAVVQSAETISALAAKTGLPPASLDKTIADYNRAVANGFDAEFGRFGTAENPASGAFRPITEPPFFALRLLPMTRKSLGGLAINPDTQVLDKAGQSIAGLYAAGEATGVAGINGRYGGSGTFLGPSVLTGRIAGRQAAAYAQRVSGTRQAFSDSACASDSAAAAATISDAKSILGLLAVSRPGFWHWERSHLIVIDRELECTGCHSTQWPTRPARTERQQLLQLDTCTECH